MLFSVKLNQNRDFQRAYRRAKSYTSSILVTYCIRGKRDQNRFGITTSRRIGGAVQRNRARRIITEAYRQLEPQLRTGWDFVFVARTRTIDQKTEDVKQVMQRHLQAAGVWKGERS